MLTELGAENHRLFLAMLEFYRTVEVAMQPTGLSLLHG